MTAEEKAEHVVDFLQKEGVCFSDSTRDRIKKAIMSVIDDEPSEKIQAPNLPEGTQTTLYDYTKAEIDCTY